VVTSSFVFFFSSRRRHTRFSRDWSSDVCSSDLRRAEEARKAYEEELARLERENDAYERAVERSRREREAANRAQQEYFAAQRRQIGRASCRESVWIAGGSVAREKRDESSELGDG